MPRHTRSCLPRRSRVGASSSSRVRALTGVMLCLLALGGCAPDAWKPNPNFSAFLNQVERVCGTTRIGEVTVSQLMNPGSSLYSAYFVDMTSRFDLGRITVDEYVLGLSTTFNTVRDSAGISCIVAQKTP